MTILIENIPHKFDYEAMKKYVSRYTKVFSLEKLKERETSWDGILDIPYVISRMMVVELLDGQQMDGCTISIKELEEKK